MGYRGESGEVSGGEEFIFIFLFGWLFMGGVERNSLSNGEGVF